MSYEALEASAESGQPVELFFFRYGSDPGAYFAYCDGPIPITRDVAGLGPTEFQPIPIDRGRVPVSGSLDKTRLTVRLPSSAGIVELFRIYPPSRVVTLVIRETHYGDPDAETSVLWVGRVLNSSRGKSQQRDAELACEPSQTSMRRNGLRRFYSLSCTHDLYGPRCRADKAAATFPNLIAGVAYSKLTLTPGWHGSFLPKDFVGGIVEWPGPVNREYRTIMRVVGDELHLTGPTSELAVGDTVDVILGCRHNEPDCIALHDNILNYGGQPYIPLENPIRSNPFTM